MRFAYVISLILLFNSALQAQIKLDTIILVNNDIITGEIKDYEFGFFTFDGDELPKFSLKETKVSTIRSPRTFNIRYSDGIVYSGKIIPRPLQEGYIPVLINSDTFLMNINRIVQMTPSTERIWRRFSGNVSLGISYTKASDVFQLSFNGKVSYLDYAWLSNLEANSIITTTSSDDRTRKQDLTFQLFRQLPKKWLVYTVLSAEQNTGLDLDLRRMIQFGGGYNIIYKGKSRFVTAAGLAFNTESYASEAADVQNQEGTILTSYRFKSPSSPDADITFSNTFFYSFSVDGRYRNNFQANISIKVIGDLRFGLSGYWTYDSKPQTAEGLSSDFGIINNFTYKFD